MKVEALLLLAALADVFAQNNNLRIPNIFANNGEGGFSFSNIFRPNNNRPQKQKNTDSKKLPKDLSPAPFLVAPPPGFQPPQQAPISQQQPQQQPQQQQQQQNIPIFPQQQQLFPQPPIQNQQLVVPQNPLPLERPRLLAPSVNPPLFLQPQNQQVFAPPVVQQQQNPFFQLPVVQSPAPLTAPPSPAVFKRQPQPQNGFTPFAPQLIGTAAVKNIPSPVENQIQVRPNVPQSNPSVLDSSRQREPSPKAIIATKRPSFKEKTYLDCGPGNDLGFCAASDRYPGVHVDRLMEKCRTEVKKMYAEIPEDPELLADTAIANSILRNLTRAKDAEAPSWSWAAYKKESACDAERRMIVPGIAKDKNGKWMVIVQTTDMPQRVHMEMCRNPEGACKVMSDCGRKSRCGQRYSWHLLIAVDQAEPDSCPSMAAFRFPTSCICHIEIEKPRLIRAPPMSKKMDQDLEPEEYEPINSEESLAAIV